MGRITTKRNLTESEKLLLTESNILSQKLDLLNPLVESARNGDCVPCSSLMEVLPPEYQKHVDSILTKLGFEGSSDKKIRRSHTSRNPEWILTAALLTTNPLTALRMADEELPKPRMADNKLRSPDFQCGFDEFFNKQCQIAAAGDYIPRKYAHALVDELLRQPSVSHQTTAEAYEKALRRGCDRSKDEPSPFQEQIMTKRDQ